jgi:hypothetical protein
VVPIPDRLLSHPSQRTQPKKAKQMDLDAANAAAEALQQQIMQL